MLQHRQGAKTCDYGLSPLIWPEWRLTVFRNSGPEPISDKEDHTVQRPAEFQSYRRYFEILRPTCHRLPQH